MKYMNKYANIPTQLFRKYVGEYLWALRSFIRPILRFRRPILPRA
ncbi:hypothetical protein FM107_20480 [Sphingobacterium sp. JB170]|nr:hypothetical protein FM107_20480 [Sphingobacterium sp. JB170]